MLLASPQGGQWDQFKDLDENADPATIRAAMEMRQMLKSNEMRYGHLCALAGFSQEKHSVHGGVAIADFLKPINPKDFDTELPGHAFNAATRATLQTQYDKLAAQQTAYDTAMKQALDAGEEPPYRR